MNVLISCEESQSITIAFRNKGHNAYSNDIKDCSGGHPEWHFKEDCRIAISRMLWDIIIFHPDCTYMAVSGNRWYGNGTPGIQKRIDAVKWTLETWRLIKKHSLRSALENPVSVIFSCQELSNPQYIQPWMFGHGETKKTGLYLRNLPKLEPTNIVEGREHNIWKMPPSENRKELRSKTYQGIATAMSEQWGNL